MASRLELLRRGILVWMLLAGFWTPWLTYGAELRDRQILVVLAPVDEGHERLAGPDGYRLRGVYESSRWVRRVARRLGHDYALEQLDIWPMRSLDRHCVVYDVGDRENRAEVISQLATDTRVALVQPMHRFVSLSGAASAGVSAVPESQQSAAPDYKVLQRVALGYDPRKLHRLGAGAGISIAVVDTAVDDRHLDLRGQISYQKSYVDTPANGFSAEFHGTAVIGIIAAIADNGEGISGISPEARITALGACQPIGAGQVEAECSSYQMALALDEAIVQQVDIINLSVIGPHDSLLEVLIGRALGSGIVVVAADTESGPTGSRFPASMPGVMAVQNGSIVADLTTASGGYAMSAPGDDILTTFPGSSYGFVSGSSFAAAQITGLLALHLQGAPDCVKRRESCAASLVGFVAAALESDASEIDDVLHSGAELTQFSIE